MTISQVAQLSGVGVETVRFYERAGLLNQPARPETGYRQYSLDAVKRIQFIKRAKELGFSLKEIAELLTLRMEPATTCADVKKQAQAKMDEIESKIASLLRIKYALAHIAARCSGDTPRESCPILEALEHEPVAVLALNENRQEKHMETVEEYQCPICQLHFREKSLQQQCETWCRTHNSCNLHIASQSQEAQKIAQIRPKQLREEQA